MKGRLTLALALLLLLPGAALAQLQGVVSWTLVADEPTATPTSYKIDRNADGGAFVQIGTTPTGIVSFTDAPLSRDVTYCWVIIATNNGGDGPASAQACAGLPTPAKPPGQVLGVTVILSPIPE